MTQISGFFFVGLQFLPVFLFVFLSVKLKIKPGFGLFLLLFLYGIYNVFVPLADYFTQVHSFFGFEYPVALILNQSQALVYCLGISALLIGYFILKIFFKKQEDFQSLFFDFQQDWIPKVMIGFQLVLWALVVFNIQSSGISFFKIFDFNNQSEKDILFSADWQYPFLDLLSNCIPVCLYLQFRFTKGEKRIWFVFFFFWLIISLLSGWRYRIILLGILFIFHFLSISQIRISRLIPFLILVFVSFCWLTLNRMAIAKRQFQLITFDLSQFDLQIATNEFSNSRTFRSTLLYLDKNPEVQKQASESWVVFLKNKFKSKSNFSDHQRPKPWILSVTKAWIPNGWPWNPNPAVTQLEEFFLTFGYLGVFMGMLLVGFWSGFLDVKVDQPVFQSFKLVGTALLFQWTTRGFFLYQLQITLICILPFLVLYVVKPYLPHGSAANKA
jgi:hypothetical protein